MDEQRNRACSRAAQLVWLKRDLRLADHAPLADAVQAGPTLLLYIHAVYFIESRTEPKSERPVAAANVKIALALKIYLTA